MISAILYDQETKTNHDTVIPDGSSFFELDMDKIIKCAKCGDDLKYGDSYTSRTIMNKVGFGYAVCHDCYMKEW